MTGEEKLNEFLQAIASWLASKNLPLVDENPKIKTILNIGSEELEGLSRDSCACYAYELHAYSEYVEGVRAKEKIILDWADASIWHIISTAMHNYGTQYTKWQEKYYAAIKENPLANDILKIKNHAESRVTLLTGKSERIQKMADVLNTLSRRR